MTNKLIHPLSSIFIGLLLFVLSTVSHASEVETRYQQVCASCHGKSAEGNSDLGGPALAGQQAAYIARQIDNFKNGVRGNHAEDTYGKQMAAMSNTLANQKEVVAMAEFLSGLAVAEQNAAQGDVKNGFKYYQSCGSCHGAKAEGNASLSSPRLAGLSAGYLMRQHENFVNGLRGSHQDDRYGKQMKMMADTVRDKTVLRDIIAFITSIDK